MDPQFGYSSDLDDKPGQARKAVLDLIRRECTNDPAVKHLTLNDVYVVSFSYILGNWKAYVSTTRPDFRIYEVTYSKEKNEIFLDVYVKQHNETVRPI